MSKSSIARSCQASWQTVDRWIERAAAAARGISDTLVKEIQAREVQADELRAHAVKSERNSWVFTSVEVSARLWLAHRAGKRTRRSTRIFTKELKQRCATTPERVLVTTDGFKYYPDSMERAFGPSCVYVQIEKRISDNRVRRVSNLLRIGHPWQLEDALARSEDSKRPNTSFVERLNLFVRRSTAALHRKTNAPSRSDRKLGELMDVLQLAYNFLRPHGALRFGTQVRTPAQQAGLVTRRLSFRDLFMALRYGARPRWIVQRAGLAGRRA
jgi:IS1 family transposase